MNAGERFDVCVIGAGVVGSSIAMALAERNFKVAAVDIDLSGRLSSSEKNAGGVRATWWQPVNITLCRASIEYYEKIAPQVGFKQKGYLWLYDDATWPEALAHVDLQRSLGHPIETLPPEEVGRRFPEIDKLDGMAGATFSPRDGLINPNCSRNTTAMRRFGAALSSSIASGGGSGSDISILLNCWRADASMSDEGLIRLMTGWRPGQAELGHLSTRCRDVLSPAAHGRHIR